MYEENAPGWFDHASLDPEGASEFYASLSGHDVTSPGPDMRVLQKGEQWYASLTQLPSGESPQWKRSTSWTRSNAFARSSRVTAARSW